MNIRYLFFVLFATLILVQCKKDEKKKEVRHDIGEVDIVVDPSLKNLATSLTEAYVYAYPKVKMNLSYKVEDLAIDDFINAKANMAIVSKTLTEKQADYLASKSGLRYEAVPVACDAAVFITAINSDIQSIRKEDIPEGILNQNSDFVFDNGNSTNINTIIKKLEINKNIQQIQAFDGSEKLIDFISQSKTKIGILGLNDLSDEDNPKIQEYLNKVKIIPVIDKNDTIYPISQNLFEQKYPFTRFVYLLKNETGFDIGSGLSRFIGSRNGQLIVLKEGLQPYYVYKRMVR